MHNHTSQAQPSPLAVPSARAQALPGALAAALLGAVIIWVVGFSHVEAIHNAAHDTRHSHAFPCH